METKPIFLLNCFSRIQNMTLKQVSSEIEVSLELTNEV